MPVGSGFENSLMYAENADFSGSSNPAIANGLALDGQVWMGTTAANAGGTHINVVTLAAGAGVTLTQAGSTFTIGLTGGGAAVEHLTADSGGQLNPDGSNNFNLLGSGSLTTVGAGSTITMTLTGLTNHAVLIGAGTTTITKVGPTATAGQVLQSAGAAADPAFSTATYPLTTTVSQILYSSSTNTVTGLATANKAVLTTGATGIPVLTPISTDGTFIIGSTAGAPASGTITSTGGTITITPGSNTINIDLVGGTLAVDSFSPDSGTDPVVPTAAGLVNDKGSGSITTVGSLNTITTQLTGLTNHAVLVGAGTTTITKVGPSASTGQILQNNAAADPSYSTATYPSTTVVSQILYSSATNVVSGLSTANRAVLTTGTTGIPVLTALAVDGQIIIGSTAGVPAAATLTAGTGITITNASNSITIAVTGSGFTWTDVTTATQAMLVENGYLTDRGAGVVYTLPASAAIGDEIIVVGKLGITTITPNANQQILMSSASGTVGVTGTIVGTNVGDCVTLICTNSGASTIWRAVSFVGNWTVN